VTPPCSTLRATLSGGGGGSGRESRDFGNAVSRKVCVLGYMGVGKSSLTIQYAEWHFILFIFVTFCPGTQKGNSLTRTARPSRTRSKRS
jgi:hypothetical protein